MQPLALATPATVASDTAKDKANNRVFIRFAGRLGGCGLHSVASKSPPTTAPIGPPARPRGRPACMPPVSHLHGPNGPSRVEYRPRSGLYFFASRSDALVRKRTDVLAGCHQPHPRCLETSSVDFPGMEEGQRIMSEACAASDLLSVRWRTHNRSPDRKRPILKDCKYGHSVPARLFGRCVMLPAEQTPVCKRFKLPCHTRSS